MTRGWENLTSLYFDRRVVKHSISLLLNGLTYLLASWTFAYRIYRVILVCSLEQWKRLRAAVQNRHAPKRALASVDQARP
jgi:hypothetical protein